MAHIRHGWCGWLLSSGWWTLGHVGWSARHALCLWWLAISRNRISLLRVAATPGRRRDTRVMHALRHTIVLSRITLAIIPIVWVQALRWTIHGLCLQYFGQKLFVNVLEREGGVDRSEKTAVRRRTAKLPFFRLLRDHRRYRAELRGTLCSRSLRGLGRLA